MSAPSGVGPKPWTGVVGCAALLFFLLLFPIAVPASAAGPAPLPGGEESATGAWAVAPMGQLSDSSNTFWQLLKGHPGSSTWSVVTPQGVADNGGIVAAASDALVVVGILPSGLLHFSPLSLSEDGGTTWSPAFLPGALAARPDALAVGPAGALAIVGRSVLHATQTLHSWSRLVSLAALRSTGARCAPGAIDAVAFAPSGLPMVATSCTRGGRVGLFTFSAGRWVPTAVQLPGRLRSATTSVLALTSGTGVTTALISAHSARGDALLVLWQSRAGAWSSSAPLPLPSGASVRSTAGGVGGAMTLLVGSRRTDTAYQVFPGRLWVRLPSPPAGTVALASTTPPSRVVEGIAADSFVVDGTVLHVFALTPAGTTWALVQTTNVPLAYGSSG